MNAVYTSHFDIGRPASLPLVVDVAGFKLQLGDLGYSMIQAKFAPYSTSFILMSRTLRKVLVLPVNPTNTSTSIEIRSGRLISRDNSRIQVLTSKDEEEKVIHIHQSA